MATTPTIGFTGVTLVGSEVIVSATISRALCRGTAILAVALIATVIGPPRNVRAQDRSPGAVTVTVRDSVGLAVVGAELFVDGQNIHGVTDERGMARFVAAVMGPTTLRVRRLGFQPATVEVTVDPRVPAAANVTLVRVAQRLSPVVVRGMAHDMTGRLAGFYQRREQGLGHFITRERLDRENPSQLTDMFRRLPGVQIVNTRTIRNAVRFRGQRCWPLVWLDGAPLPAGEFDIDVLAASSLEGIEVYEGPATVPPQFMSARGLGSCGVIVVWSREVERREKKRKKQMTPAEIAEMVASLSVFTAEQVDSPAHPDSSAQVQPMYPDSLFDARQGGEVHAEFVVDTTGQVLLDTFNVITTTHPYFSTAVRNAMRDAVYTPAILKGKRVKQVVQQPFKFVIDSTVMRRGRPRQ
jgi:hypothetical protein